MYPSKTTRQEPCLPCFLSLYRIVSAQYAVPSQCLSLNLVDLARFPCLGRFKTAFAAVYRNIRQMDAAAGQTFARSGRLNGPNAPTKRKSSNILGSLGRAATISDRHDKSKDGANGTEGPSDVAMYSGLPPASATSFDAPASPALSTATSQQQYFSSQAGANPSQSLSTALDSLKQAMAKRLETWKYLKSVHQGQQTLWFHTIALTRADLEHHLNQGRSNAAGANLQKRTLRFMLLGLNLSPIMDMPSSTEFLKALSLLTQDFDQLSDDTLSRTRMVCSCCLLVLTKPYNLILLTLYSRGPSLDPRQGSHAHDPTLSVVLPMTASHRQTTQHPACSVPTLYAF